jgi:pilus assembly protein CpaB
VTIEVLPKQAEMISVAAELGKLSLTLRSVPTDTEPVTTDDNPDVPTQSTWAYDVSPALKPQRVPLKAATEQSIHVIHGSKVEDVKD